VAIEAGSTPALPGRIEVHDAGHVTAVCMGHALVGREVGAAPRHPREGETDARTVEAPAEQALDGKQDLVLREVARRTLTWIASPVGAERRGERATADGSRPGEEPVHHLYVERTRGDVSNCQGLHHQRAATGAGDG
jgi:hypothetical protein